MLTWFEPRTRRRHHSTVICFAARAGRIYDIRRLPNGLIAAEVTRAHDLTEPLASAVCQSLREARLWCQRLAYEHEDLRRRGYADDPAPPARRAAVPPSRRVIKRRVALAALFGAR